MPFVVLSVPPINPICEDVIAYTEEGAFVIIMPYRKDGRELPAPPDGLVLPYGIPCTIKEGQTITLGTRHLTLHHIHERFVCLKVGADPTAVLMEPLNANTYFAICPPPDNG